MPDRFLDRWLFKLLPSGARKDLFEPAWYDLQAERLGGGRGFLWYHVQLLRLFAECWRVHSIPEFKPPSSEWTAVFLQNLSRAFRALRREPAFALAAILTLALGVGANVAVFSLVESVLLRPLPYPAAGRLAILRHRDQRSGITKEFIAIGDFVDLAQRQTSFEALAGYDETHPIIMNEAEPLRVSALAAAPGLLETLRVSPVLGRTIQAADAAPNAAPVALVSYDFWQARLGSDPHVVGRGIKMEQGEMQIIGVLPRGFSFPPDTQHDLVIPMASPVQAPSARQSSWTFVVARLKPGVSFEQAGANLLQLSRRLEQEFPTTNRGSEYYVVPLRDELAGETKSALLIGLAAVGFVLLIACVNVANLLLARSVARRREMAVRMALGASYGRLTAQLITESLALAALAGVAGIGMACWAPRALTTFIPKSFEVSGLAEAHINGPVLGFALGIIVLTALICGWISALSIRTTSASGALVSSVRVSANRSVRRSSSALVVAEVAMATVLLLGAGLVLRTLALLLSVDPGFRTDHVLTISVELSGKRYRDVAARRALFSRLAPEVCQIPGIQSAGAAVVVPLTGNNWTVPFERAEHRAPRGQRPPELGWQSASGGYFKSLQIPLRYGRLFDERDAAGPPVVIVSQAVERRFFPNERAVGHAIIAWGQKMEIVGVVGDIRRGNLRDQPRQDVYFPLEGNPVNQFTLFFRTATEPLSMLAAVEGTLRSIEPAMVVTEAHSMDEFAADSLRVTRLSMWLLGAFASISLALAAVGIYGVTSYTVRQRTREIGMRVALGATARDIVWLVMKQGVGIAALGIVLGTGLGLLAARALRSMLYGVTPADPLTAMGVALVLTAAAMLASYLPAHQAAGIDPARTLADV